MILIVCRSVIFGGIEILAQRLSSYLEKNQIEHAVLANPESPLHKSIQSDKIFNEVASIPNYGSIRHILLLGKIDLNDKLSASIPHARILVWILHPHAAYSKLFPGWERWVHHLGYRASQIWLKTFGSHKKNVDNFFRLLEQKKALAFMDGATKRSFQYLTQLELDCARLIPIPVRCQYLEKPDQEPDLNLGYFGRMDAMKFSALAGVLQSEFKHKIDASRPSLHFIGAGDYKQKLEKLCSKLKIEFIDYGFRDNDEARQILRDKTDLALAMGTAALDIAATGHPVIIIDPSTTKFACDQRAFSIVSEIEDFTLGEFRDFPKYKTGKNTFSAALHACLIDNYKTGLSCYNYAKTHHNPDLIFASLLSTLQASELTLNEYQSKLREVSISINKPERAYSVIGHFLMGHWFKSRHNK